MAEIENLKIGANGTIHIVGNENIITEEWEASKTYVKDKSYVIREHKLYVCNVTHTSTSSFDPTKWTEITVIGAIDNALDMTDTASGAIATFESEYALPLRDLEIEINAVQESGTPTPSSPKAISGFTGANIKVQSRNWIPLTVSSVKSANPSFTWSDNVGTYHALTITLLTDDGITITGIKVNGTADAATNIMTPAYSVQGSYIFNGCVSGGTTDTYYMACRVNGNWLTTARDFGNGVTVNGTITQSAITIANGAQITNLVFKPMLRVSTDTDSTYTPYTATTTAISWNDEAGTVYGGSLDVTTGLLTVTHGYIDLGSLTWTHRTDIAQGVFSAQLLDYKFSSDVQAKCDIYVFSGTSVASGLPSKGNNTVCFYYDSQQTARYVYVYDTSYSDANTFKTAMSGHILAYELATPQTIQLTPTEISAIVGTNNVFTDTNGDTSLEYYTKRGEQTVHIAEGVAVDVINNKNIDNLTTTHKTLVGAVNEVNKHLTYDVIHNFSLNNDTWNATVDGTLIVTATASTTTASYVYLNGLSKTLGSIVCPNGAGGYNHGFSVPCIKGQQYKLLMGGFTSATVMVVYGTTN